MSDEEQDEQEQKQLAQKKVSEGADTSVFMQKLASMQPREKTPEEKAELEKKLARLQEKIEKMRQSAPAGI